MILQALTEYYESLVALPDIRMRPTKFGWGQTIVRFAVLIDLSGNLKEIALLEDETNSKGRLTTVPLQLKRSGIKPPPYFLCDSAEYVLGIGKDGASKRSKAYFGNFSEYNKEILSHIDCPEARAVSSFFDKWNPDSALNDSAIQNALSHDLSKGNFAFYITDTRSWVLDSPEIQRGWTQHFQENQAQGDIGICLVTGKEATIARIHNSVKGIYATSPSPNGWTLVSFDKGSPAFSSYGKKQGFNAPVGEYAAFAYTAALNHLLADREHVYRVGDATVVCWARGGGSFYQSLFGWAAMGQPEPNYDEGELRGMVKRLCRGETVEFQVERLDPNMDFYILGLSPNASRLSVRFFLRNTFGGFLRNAEAHQERLKIVRPSFDKFEELPVWKLLSETVNQNTRDKAPAPELAGEVLRAILTDTRYPATLLNGATLRIRAEQEVTRGRAAILKAYYLKNPHPDVPKEVLTVAVNEGSNNIPYVLGRIFSVLEAIQSAANPGINTTIKDKYFNSAAATPAVIFPLLINLAQKHLKKLRGSNTGLAISLDKQLADLLYRLDENYPAHTNLSQQGSFQLGYYHQTQARYQKKEEN